MTFWQALKESYRGSFGFLVACPLLALVPTLFEMLQHVIEVQMGVYDSIEAAQALDGDPVRLFFGLLKTVAISMSFYWVVRWLVKRDAQFAATFETSAVRLFSAFLAFRVAMTAAQLFLLPGTAVVTFAELIVGEAITTLIAAWGVASALGNPRVGPIQSVALMGRHFPWSFLLILLAMLPLFVVHIAFGIAATLGPKPLLWPFLIADALVVAWLTALIVATTYFASTRAAEAEGVELMPPSPSAVA